MVNCIFGSFIKGPDKHLLQGPEIVCGGPGYTHNTSYKIHQAFSSAFSMTLLFKLFRHGRRNSNARKQG